MHKAFVLSGYHQRVITLWCQRGLGDLKVQQVDVAKESRNILFGRQYIVVKKTYIFVRIKCIGVVV